MPRLIAALLLLGACAAPVARDAAFRDPAAPIYSNAAFMPQQLVGRWQQAATVATAKAPACAPGGVEFTAAPAGLVVSGLLCLNGRTVRLAGPVAPLGPGRFGLPGLGEAWVIWVDADNRTLAFATPSGAWGFVLDEGRLPPDRFVAAAEIFGFNGYAPGSLRPF